MTPKLFTELGLSPESLKAIERLGFEQASPIQAEAIPVLMTGRDVVGQSQTGSGKTAAFGLPAIERMDPKIRGVQVLALCPTRELAVQVSEEIHKLAYFKRGVKALPIFGGASYDRQLMGLRSGANFIIGTPGRVKDHIERGTLKLDQVRTVILDEADEMLDMGFREDIESILQHTPAERQTVLFSATIPPPIEQLIRKFTKEAVRVQISAKALTVPTVEQVYYEVQQQWKFEAMTRLIDLHDVKLGIVFCNTQRTVDGLTEQFHNAGYDADALHGGLAQPARDRVMKKFKNGALTLLVATDVAGRGIDVNDVEVVFNFDLPYDPEDYVHRIGRTGRAGRSGLAITLVSGRDFFRIRHLERFTRQRIKRGTIPSQDELAKVKDRQLFDDVRTVIQHGDTGGREHLIQRLMEEGFDSVQIGGALLHLLAGGEVPKVTDAVVEKRSLWAEEGAVVPAASQPLKAVPPPAKPPLKAVRPEKPVRQKPAAVPALVVAEPVSPAVEQPVPVADAQSDSAAGEPSRREIPVEEPATPDVASPTPTSELAAEIPPAEPAVVTPAEDGFPSGETAASEVPPQPTEEVLPVAKVKKSTPRPVPPPAAPVTGEPPQFKSSVWDRPAFTPQSPRVPREQRPPSSPPPPDRRTWDRPQRSFERERSFPPQRDDRAPYGQENRGQYRDERSGPPPMRYTARPDGSMTQLWLGVGEVDGVTPRDIVGCILGETGLHASVVGKVQLFDRHALVEVTSFDSQLILARLNRAVLRGRQLRAKLAGY